MGEATMSDETDETSESDRDQTPAARARTTSQRVALIADMMASGRWILRVSARQLAAQWGISESRVRHLSSEANRVLRAELSAEDREAIRAKLLATLDRVILLSMHRQRYRDAVSAIQAYGDFLGLRSQRLIVSDEDPDRFAGWSAADLRRYAEEGIAPERRGALRAIPGGKSNGQGNGKANGSNGHG